MSGTTSDKVSSIIPSLFSASRVIKLANLESNKKHIMASILANLKEFFMEQIHNEDKC